MRAVIYPRVSSTAQRDAGTIESQLSTLPAIVTRRGWELVRPATCYADDGVTARSGKLRGREGFHRLIADAQLGAFDVVLVVGLDRLTRTEDFGELGKILGPLQKAGVLIADGEGEPIDLGTRSGRWMAIIKAMVSADENEARRERTMRGRREAARKGKPPGKRPWGLAYDRDKGTWYVDEPKAEVVREIFRRVVGGESGQTIGADLHRRCVPCPQGGTWYRARVRLIVRQAAYRGKWQGLHDVTLEVPRIVDDELWYAAQAALTDSKKRGLHRTRHVYLVEGIGACGLCGSKIMIHSSKARDGSWRRHYLCDRRLKRVLGNPCALPLLRVETVDARVWASIEHLATRSDLIEAAASERSEEAAAWEGDVGQYERRLERLASVEKGVLDRYHRGLISDAALDDELGRVSRERKLLEQQVAVARTRSLAGAMKTAAITEATAILRARAVAALTPTDKRDLVRAMIPGRGVYRITLQPDGSILAVALLAVDGNDLAVRLAA